MFDIATHIGRKLVNEKAEGEKELINTEVGYYGTIPTNLLAEECEEIVDQVKRSDELEKFLKSAKNGHAKYLKMRTPASKHGTQKMKEASRNIKDHPLFADKSGDQEAILREIKEYKPKKGTKMAFVNPFSQNIQQMVDYSKAHRPERLLQQVTEPQQKEVQEAVVESELEESKEVQMKEPVKEKAQNKKKRQQPESYKDPNTYIPFEPTTSQERLRQVFFYCTSKVAVGRRGAYKHERGSARNSRRWGRYFAEVAEEAQVGQNQEEICHGLCRSRRPRNQRKRKFQQEENSTEAEGQVQQMDKKDPCTDSECRRNGRSKSCGKCKELNQNKERIQEEKGQPRTNCKETRKGFEDSGAGLESKEEGTEAEEREIQWREKI
eukprot:TRINITY_DN135710_c1_g1_i1.p2 TRINITY_DN135710_c1_g1~~TRINITY_DN135710_c1_g1_i1.p2  ORF type:complete len:380 (-),score=64.20 TRINITY_DN135710_c1_g1_i1:120-1259(-)